MCLNLSNTPLVSIACISYNQAKYIREAIESFLMQKTNFTYEILIHDDASTDGTDQIIKEYALKYPNLIFPTYQSENQFSKGVRRILATFVFPKCRGKYIALCEGDDYWLSSDKLQKQVDILDARDDISFCFHNNLIIDENDAEKVCISNPKQSIVTTIEDIIDAWYVMTCSIMFRNAFIKELPPWYSNFKTGDYILQLILATHGDVYYIDEIMGVYRIHKGGISRTFKMYDSQYDLIDLLLNFNKYTNNQYKYSIHKRISKIYKKLALYYKTDWNIPYFMSSIAKCVYYHAPQSLREVVNLGHFFIPYHKVPENKL